MARTYFAIVSMGRSGSTYVERLLNSHPNIRCLGEVISKSGGYSLQSKPSIEAYIEEVLFGDHDGVLGFKMPWDHIVDFPDVFGVFRRLDFKLIFLRRANKLDQLLSVKLAQLNNQWESDSAYTRQNVEITYDEARTFFTTATYTDGCLKRMCDRFDNFGVTYEDLIAGKEQAPLLSFLGQEVAPLQSGTIRSRTSSQRDAVANYDALAEQFRSTPWIAFFTDKKPG